MYYQKTMDFSEWLVAKLREKGWSRSEAARRGDISASMYDKVINGHAKPGLKFLEGVAKAFKMDLAEVLKYANEAQGISDEMTRLSQELISNFKLEGTKRKAYEQLKRLADQEAKAGNNGSTSPKHSSTTKAGD